MTTNKPKPHNGGQWTEARMHSFIKGALRAASNRWPPRWSVKKEAQKERGRYWCTGYKKRRHLVAAKEVEVDHIDPVINPETGFVSWDETIKRMFCEADGLQVLCKTCHKTKTANERKKKNK